MGNSPGWTFGYVPTAAEWNQAFADKQDDLGYIPVNQAGDTMLGRFVTYASITARAGFNIPPGVAPSSPVDGDMWLSASGLYFQDNGETVGPISTGTVTSIGLTAPAEIVVDGSPVTGNGQFELSWASQPANNVFIGPASGADGTPSFRTLVGADLPTPTESAKGAVFSYTPTANQFLTGIGTDGNPTVATPNVVSILGYTPLNRANNLSDVTNPALAAQNIGAVSTGAVNTFTAMQIWSKGADIASAATLTLGTDGNYFNVTGTTTITAISSGAGSQWVKLHFNGALTLTHNATSLVLPNGGNNIVTVAGDEAEFVQYSTGNWRCVSYQKRTLAGINALTAQTATGVETALNFTNIPAGVKRITVTLANFSTNGTSNPVVQLGTSGGYDATSYLGSAANVTGSGVTGSNISVGFRMQNSVTATTVFGGQMVLTRITGNTWACSSMVGSSDTVTVGQGSGSKTLSAELNSLRVTTEGGANTIDSGSIVNVLYEF